MLQQLSLSLRYLVSLHTALWYRDSIVTLSIPATIQEAVIHFFANYGIHPEYEMIGDLIQGSQAKPQEMTQLHQSLRNEMVATQLR